jgi:hypothetical protein
LISVFEEGKVLELYEEDWDIALIHEETSEEHERDDEHGSEGHSKLLVREDATDDQGVTSSSNV